MSDDDGIQLIFDTYFLFFLSFVCLHACSHSQRIATKFTNWTNNKECIYIESKEHFSTRIFV